MTTAVTRAEAVLAALDAGDVEALLALVDDDVAFRFGNDATRHGRAAIAEAARVFAATFAGVEHRVVSRWEPEPDVAVSILDVIYHRRDGREVRLPCCTLLRFADGLVIEYRIHMDAGPAYAP